MNSKRSFILFSIIDILFFGILNYIDIKLGFVIKFSLLFFMVFSISVFVYIFIKNKQIINTFIYSKKLFIILYLFLGWAVSYIFTYMFMGLKLDSFFICFSIVNLYLIIYCFILTLYIIALKIRKSVEKNKPKQILYICPHCGAYTTVLQENIKNANPQCSFCETNRILINEKPTKDKRKFENHILTTYLKNYPQFDENLYLERISKEQNK